MQNAKQVDTRAGQRTFHAGSSDLDWCLPGDVHPSDEIEKGALRSCGSRPSDELGLPRPFGERGLSHGWYLSARWQCRPKRPRSRRARGRLVWVKHWKIQSSLFYANSSRTLTAWQCRTRISDAWRRGMPRRSLENRACNISSS